LEQSQMMMRKYMRGVTLTELMIVVVIVSILAMVSYPSYREYAARAKRNEAKACLLQIATLEERFYLQNNTYTADMNALGVPVMTDSGTYACAITAANANTFNATATYQNADAEAGKCLTFSIDGAGTRTSAPSPDCWTNTRL
jgi:type IV pilus assembly protein PilE